MAVNRTFTNAQGEREADFINVVVFKKQVENVKTPSKGSLAGVDGRLQTRSYENKVGQRICDRSSRQCSILRTEE